MALSKASQVMAMMLVLMTIVCLMSSEVATAVPGDAIPILELGRRFLRGGVKAAYDPPGYSTYPGGGGGYYRPPGVQQTSSGYPPQSKKP